MRKATLRVYISKYKTTDFGSCNRSKKSNDFIIKINSKQCKTLKKEIKLLYHEFTHFIVELFKDRIEYRKAFKTIGDKLELEEFMCLDVEKEVDYILRSYLRFRK